MGIDEKSGQLVECINPEHLYLGSIHYTQPDCVRKRDQVMTRETVEAMRQRFIQGISCADIGRNATLWMELMDHYLNRADSDESWQASEALLGHAVLTRKGVILQPSWELVKNPAQSNESSNA